MSSLHIHQNDNIDCQEIIFEGWLHVINNTPNTNANLPNIWTKHWIVISVDNNRISRKVILSSYRYSNVRYFTCLYL